MPQTYSLDGIRVTKEVWEKARGIFVDPREAKKVEVKKEEVKIVVEDVIKEVAKPTKKKVAKKKSVKKQ